MRAREEASASTADLEVDFADLTRLVNALRALAGDLSRDDALCRYLNDSDLAGAIDRVEHDWHKQRVTLQTFLDSAAGSVAASLAGYRRIETALAQSAAARG